MEVKKESQKFEQGKILRTGDSLFSFFDMYILNTRKHGYSLHGPRSVNGFNVLLETVTSF